MKQGKKPTRRVKEMLVEKKLNPNNWLVERQLNNQLVLVHRGSGKIRQLKLGGGDR